MPDHVKKRTYFSVLVTFKLTFGSVYYITVTKLLPGIIYNPVPHGSQHTRVSQKVKGFFNFSLGSVVTLLVFIPLV